MVLPGHPRTNPSGSKWVCHAMELGGSNVMKPAIQTYNLCGGVCRVIKEVVH